MTSNYWVLAEQATMPYPSYELHYTRSKVLGVGHSSQMTRFYAPAAIVGFKSQAQRNTKVAVWCLIHESKVERPDMCTRLLE